MTDKLNRKSVLGRVDEKRDSRVRSVTRGFENLAESNRDFTPRTAIGIIGGRMEAVVFSKSE